MKTQYKEGDIGLLNRIPSQTPTSPSLEVHYFKSPGGGLLIKTAGEDRREIEIDTANMELKYVSGVSLGPEYYLDEGYTPIPRSEFDAAYVAIIKNLNKFASL